MFIEVVYYSGYILILIVVLYVSINYSGVRICTLKAIFIFYISGKSVAVSQCTVAVVVASGLVERIYIKLRLVFA